MTTQQPTTMPPPSVSPEYLSHSVISIAGGRAGGAGGIYLAIAVSSPRVWVAPGRLDAHAVRALDCRARVACVSAFPPARVSAAGIRRLRPSARRAAAGEWGDGAHLQCNGLLLRAHPAQIPLSRRVARGHHAGLRAHGLYRQRDGEGLYLGAGLCGGRALLHAAAPPGRRGPAAGIGRGVPHHHAGDAPLPAAAAHPPPRNG